MTEIDFAEGQGHEAARFSLQGLNDARQRAHNLLLVLLGGGAGMGSLGLAQLVQGPLLGWAALAGAAWWFGVALFVALRGLRSAEVRGWASGTVVSHYDKWCAYALEQQAEGGPTIEPFLELRRQLLEQVADAADGYRQASTVAYAALDIAYKLMAATPLAAAFAAVVAWKLA